MTNFTKVLCAHDDSAPTMLAKMQLDGAYTGLEKHEWIAIIEKKAAATYGGAMSPERAFAKLITEDDEGRLFYRALKAAPGSEIKPTAPAAPRDPAEDFVGKPAHARMHALAIDHVRANPRQSYASAYSFHYTKPENAALRDEIKQEHLASIAQLHG